MRHAAYMRNYESIIKRLLEQGHIIDIYFTGVRSGMDDSLAKKLSLEYKRFNYHFPERPIHGWLWLSTRIRSIRNYVRYFHPVLKNCRALRMRALKRVPDFWASVFERLPFVIANSLRPILNGVLAFLEDVVPVVPNVIELLNNAKPDFLLMTPVVDLDSVEIEYAKAASSLGISSCLCVASWDNLTNKGIIQGKPDFVMLWNDIQKNEAMTLHHIPADRIYITGAQLFDQWFERKPAYSREHFCEKLNFRTENRIIMYVCSSSFISKEEPEFVLEWAKKIRASSDKEISRANILIRPHPSSGLKLWGSPLPGFNKIENLTIYPQVGEIPLLENSKDDYYSSIFLSDALVGINTSAFIEGAIVGKPCFSILSDKHRYSTEETVHFHYLLNDDFLKVSGNLDEHMHQLSRALNDDDYYVPSNRRFVSRFVRPNGMDAAATEEFVRILTDILPARARKLVAYKPSVLHYFVRALLTPWFRETQPACAKEMHFQISGRPDTDVKSDVVERQVKRLDMHQISETTAWREQESFFSNFGLLEKEFERICRSGKKIVLGPWVGDVETELVFWIPFLQQIRSKYSLNGDDCVVVSKGGCAAWYQNLSEQYMDIYDHLAPAEFVRKYEECIKSSGGDSKQWVVSMLDSQILRELSKGYLDSEFEIIHPYLMYWWFKPFWEGVWGGEMANKGLKFLPFNKPDKHYLDKLDLPEKGYYAVSLRADEGGSAIVNNSEWFHRFITKLSQDKLVVLLDQSSQTCDFQGFDITSMRGVRRIEHLCQPTNYLAVQAEVIAYADSFYGINSELSYVAPFYNVDTYAYYSKFESFYKTGHSMIAHDAFRAPEFGNIRPIQMLEF